MQIKRTLLAAYRLGRRILDYRTYLSVIEKLFLLKEWRSDSPQFFILGLPRSGTTLVYQYIVHRLHVAYFTNGVGGHPASPCITTLFQIRLHRRYRSDFLSFFGKVKGKTAPREAGAFWARFFGLEGYVDFQDVSAADVKNLRHTVYCLQKFFGHKPFVNKNVKHMLRLDALAGIFPRSYFLVVERDVIDIALSVFRARFRLLDNPSEWWSVKPPNYLELKDKPVVDQVAGQLSDLNKKMNADLALLPSDRVVRISYESFCRNPESLIDTIAKLVRDVKYKNPPENSFPVTRNMPENEEEKRLVRLLSNE